MKGLVSTIAIRPHYPIHLWHLGFHKYDTRLQLLGFALQLERMPVILMGDVGMG